MRRLPLISGLVLSLLVHAFLLGPAVTIMRRQASATSMVAPEHFAPEKVRDPEQPMEELVTPGIDAPTPSSLTWVGYDEYQEHLARLAETDQAAFAEATAAAEPEPELEEPQPARADVALDPGEAPAEAETELADADGEPAGAESEPESMAAVAPSEEGDAPLAPDTGAPFTQWLAQMAQAARRLSDESESNTEAGAAAVAEEPQPERPAEAEAEIGTPSDRESDPTSTIEVPLSEVRLGRPIARPGIEIRPRRPELTDYTIVTTGAGNPLVEIQFDRTGRPLSASILESSRDQRVDQSILSSLYRWRASGERIASLVGEQTVGLRVRIVWR